MLRSAMHRVDKTFEPYMNRHGNDEHQSLTAILTDLIEFCDMVGFDFDEHLAQARGQAIIHGTTKAYEGPSK